MTVSDDIQDNSVIVIIKHRGKVHAKGFDYNPKDYQSAMRAVRHATFGLLLTMHKKAFKRSESLDHEKKYD